MKARGLRNNNPLNIRHSADRWEGMRKEQTDKSFVQFESMAFGYRAAWKVLESYWKHFRQQRGVFTVRSIISRWAPPTENDTEGYIRTVLLLCGLGGNERLPRPFQGIALEKLGRLMAAMTCVECGLRFGDVSTDDIWAGYDLAFPGKRKKKCQWSTSYRPLDTPPFRIELPEDSEAEPRNWDEYWDWSAKGVGSVEGASKNLRHQRHQRMKNKVGITICPLVVQSINPAPHSHPVPHWSRMNW